MFTVQQSKHLLENHYPMGASRKGKCLILHQGHWVCVNNRWNLFEPLEGKDSNESYDFNGISHANDDSSSSSDSSNDDKDQLSVHRSPMIMTMTSKDEPHGDSIGVLQKSIKNSSWYKCEK